MKNIVVYLGSSESVAPIFKETAFALGEALASNEFAVVYGGAGIGTMKSLADGALSKGGKVIGIIPRGFIDSIKHKYPNKELIYNALGEDVILVENLSERKQKMESISDCSITLPGGGGTMDELFEYFVDRQLGYHEKPMFVLNINGFYDPIIQLLDNMKNSGFIDSRSIEYLQFVSTIDELIYKIKAIDEKEKEKNFNAYY